MKRLGVLMLLAAMVSIANAIPARRGAIVKTAPDGSEKRVYLHGNAFSHYMTDEAGNWLNEETLEPLSTEEKEARVAVNARRAQARRAQQQEMIGGELNLAPRGLLILVNFKNKAFTTPKETLVDMINGDNFSRDYTFYSSYYGRNRHITCSGSAKQYFHDVSWGQYNPVFDVVGPFNLSENYSYYGRNNDANAGKMIKEACELADADGVDFTLYDNNNDGNVDFVYVLYAGYGEADGGEANTVWPHNYDLGYYYGLNCVVDGKKVRNYACSNELNYDGGHYSGIGTFCHEFSHVLGLPDLYETNEYGTSSWKNVHTLYEWDILDYGPYNNDGNTPPGYSAYERFYMGWLKPRVLTNPEYVWLNPLNNHRDALIICEGDQHNLVGNDPNPNTFYILESRKKVGWDKYLPGQGLLITKITYDYEYWMYNEVNNSPSRMGVDIIEAKTNTSDFSKSTDAFPAGAKSWTDFTDHEITLIEIQEGGAVTFSYRGETKGQGLEGVNSEDKSVKSEKILRDGQLLIIRDGKVFDILGNRL